MKWMCEHKKKINWKKIEKKNQIEEGKRATGKAEAKRIEFQTDVLCWSERVSVLVSGWMQSEMII